MARQELFPAGQVLLPQTGNFTLTQGPRQQAKSQAQARGGRCWEF